MKVAILGAGFTGLTAAYKLAQKGHKVFVFEKEAQPGGLARGFKLKGWKWFLEENYHHLFASDSQALKLIKEVGFANKLFFKRPITGVYYRPDKVQPCQPNGIYPLDTPLNFLSFPHLSFFDKLCSGLALTYLKLTPFWQNLEKIPAKEWIRQTMGERAWEVLWQSLFVNKFGKNFAGKVPASWFWARIKKRSQKLGYIKGGFQALAEGLVREIEKCGGKVNLDSEVKEIAFSKDKKLSLQLQNLCYDRGTKIYFDKVIATLPTPVFLEITKGLSNNYIKRLRSITHLTALTLILELKRPFLEGIYWLNICNSSFPFLLLVEHTNFVDPSHYDGRHILYIGNYLPDGHSYLKKSKDELLEIFTPHLKRINPNYSITQLLNYSLFLSPFAQPVFPINYSLIKPDFTTPLPGLFLATQDQIYPWDRGVNYAIDLGKKVANLI